MGIKLQGRIPHFLNAGQLGTGYFTPGPTHAANKEWEFKIKNVVCSDTGYRHYQLKS